MAPAPAPASDKSNPVTFLRTFTLAQGAERLIVYGAAQFAKGWVPFEANFAMGLADAARKMFTTVHDPVLGAAGG